MNGKIITAMLVVAVVVVAGVSVYALSNDDDNDVAGETVTDYAGREVSIPENLDNGIVTIGRLSALRWLAYFPEEMQKVKMIDVGLKTSVESGALAYSYAYADLLKNMDDHSNDNLDESEKIVNLRPSLIIVNDMTYNTNKDKCESLGKLFPLAVIDTMGDLEGVGFWDKNYKLCERFINQADLYGKLLRNETRAEEVKGIFQSNIDAIRSYRTGDPTYTIYVGGPINQGANPLTSTYNPYPTLSLVDGKNAMGSQTSKSRIDNSPETVNGLTFDCMIVDPGTFGKGKGFDGPQIRSPNSQGVLLKIYEKNNDENPDNDVKIFMTLPTISHGANWDCVLAGAYFMAYLNYDSIDYSTMMEKASAVFTSFYGSAGEGTLNGMMANYHSLGVSVGCDVEVFKEVEIVKSGDTYLLTGAVA